MFADNTLTPKEAIRLCALGILADKTMQYSALANAVRHFVGHMIGPSLDVLGPSIELLIYEGLVDPLDGKGMEDDATLSITDDGKTEMQALLTANLRSAATELNKLIISLKFRFLHHLDQAGRLNQAELLIDVCENELARLDDLRQFHEKDEGYLTTWLDHDISLVETRLAWLQSFRDRLTA